MNNIEGRRVLVVEDDFFLAYDLAEALSRAGALVVGPVAREAEALELLGKGPIDLAVVDINLKGIKGFVVADMLAARNVPFVFATGYDAVAIPERHGRVRRWEKPFRISALVDSLGELGPRGGAGIAA